MKGSYFLTKHVLYMLGDYLAYIVEIVVIVIVIKLIKKLYKKLCVYENSVDNSLNRILVKLCKYFCVFLIIAFIIGALYISYMLLVNTFSTQEIQEMVAMAKIQKGFLEK